MISLSCTTRSLCKLIVGSCYKYLSTQNSNSMRQTNRYFSITKITRVINCTKILMNNCYKITAHIGQSNASPCHEGLGLSMGLHSMLEPHWVGVGWGLGCYVRISKVDYTYIYIYIKKKKLF